MKKANALVFGVIFITMCTCCGQVIAANKVVVIPLMSKAKSLTCTPQYATVRRYLSIPGAAFVFEAEDSATYAKRQDLGGAAKGLFAHSDNATSHSIVTAVSFPSDAEKVRELGFAICGNSSSTGSIVHAVLTERSMVDGTTSTVMEYTLDNSAGDKGCHILYSNPSLSSFSLDTERNVYFLSVSGLDGGGAFEAKRTELDYVRIGYDKKELLTFSCQ